MHFLLTWTARAVLDENVHAARVVELSAKELGTMSQNNSLAGATSFPGPFPWLGRKGPGNEVVAGALHRILSCWESTVFSLTRPFHALQTVAKMTNETFAEILRQKIWDNQTHSNASYYRGNFHFEEDYGTSHLSVLSPDGDAVALTSTINFL